MAINMRFLSKKDVFKTIFLSFIHISTELSTGYSENIHWERRLLETCRIAGNWRGITV